MSGRLCANAVPRDEVKQRFETLAARDYVGQQQAWNYVRFAMEAYTGLAPRATCRDWVLHFTGPSGSGKSFLAELVANAAFDTWEEEPYSMPLLGLASTACVVAGALTSALGPLGMGVGCTAGVAGANAAWNAYTSTFRAPRPFPSQCGVIQHKFSRSSGVDDVLLWEYSVAKELLRDPAAIIVVDDINRLKDSDAFERFGRLLCGLGGNSIPEFRSGPGDSQLVPASQALFLLTSDLELDTSDHISCEMQEFDEMLDNVRTQSTQFWQRRALHVPDWWEQLPIVPFRELCADELSQATQKYLYRQCEMASQLVRADLQRRSTWAIGRQRVLIWTGNVRFGIRSLSTIDAYITEQVAQSKLVGGRQGAWVVSDLHQLVMRPALQTLTVRNERGDNLITEGGHHVHVTWPNYTTITYTADVCLEITPSFDVGLPRVRFSRMLHMCH
ncbi:hypothetical protein AB1Y20_020254 [Prymnesium parvum]|uniref:AAA+ ATPase domain-containing protein n=1 Tax=Prymnesium parvum TaxID=97485 RepID=A0AB34JU58_PRYPA